MSLLDDLRNNAQYALGKYDVDNRPMHTTPEGVNRARTKEIIDWAIDNHEQLQHLSKIEKDALKASALMDYDIQQNRLKQDMQERYSSQKTQKDLLNYSYFDDPANQFASPELQNYTDPRPKGMPPMNGPFLPKSQIGKLSNDQLINAGGLPEFSKEGNQRFIKSLLGL